MQCKYMYSLFVNGGSHPYEIILIKYYNHEIMRI